ncbi:MAG: prepilin-type N-terminal cleavage/methylation domain-containing protein [Candidatus Solibacter usitatus]|nr:prepilin-type N-terminal cleavage/methylation domain-containing protein [Candidatus Solibacter usitatus]
MTLGRRRSAAKDAGVTLVEMLIVVTIVGLIAGISFPSVASGLESLRLNSATDSIVGLLNGAMNRAERRQLAMEIIVSVQDNSLSLASSEAGFTRSLSMPDGVKIVAVWPKLPEEDNQPRHFLLLPGSTVPRLGVEIANRKGARRIVRVNPITGVPDIERVEAP